LQGDFAAGLSVSLSSGAARLRVFAGRFWAPHGSQNLASFAVFSSGCFGSKWRAISGFFTFFHCQPDEIIFHSVAQRMNRV